MEPYVTGHSHNANGTLHYIYYGTYKTGHGKLNQAHANPNGVKNRNVLLFGVNCRRGYRQAVHDFNRYLKQKPNNKVQTLNVVLSFAKSDFDFNNKEDCYRASEIAKEFVSKAFPHHQAIIALQHDNKHAIPHVHLIVNAISMKAPYYTIPAKSYGIGRLRAIGADCIKDYDNQFDTKISGVTTHKGNGYQKPSADQERVIRALDDEMSLWTINTHSKLRNAMRKDHHINLSFKRRGSRRRRKRKRRGRRRYKRSGLVFKFVTRDKNGKKRNHYVKASSLGRVQDSESTFTNPSDYTLAGIDKKLNANREHEKQAKANQKKAEAKAQRKARNETVKQHPRAINQQNIILKEQRKRENARKKRKEANLQRQRSNRINQVQSAITESAHQCHQYDKVVSRPKPEISKSSQQLPDELRHATKQTWGVGTLGKVVTRIGTYFEKAYQYVRSETNKVYNFINQERKKHQQKAKWEQRQKIAPDYTCQHWFTNENGSIERTGDHLELYLRHAAAFKSHKNNKVSVRVTPYYRRDISQHYGGQPVRSIYSRGLERYFHDQIITLNNFNKILRCSNQPTFNEQKLSDVLAHQKSLTLIDGKTIKPAPFKAPVRRYRRSYMFNPSRVAPSVNSFSYAFELLLNRQWHLNHDFNMKRNRYWAWYSNMYKNDHGVRPNPKNTGLLHDFQSQIEYAMRSGQRKRNEPLTPYNQIERSIDKSVNADPDNADNYTRPWYVKGTDIHPSDGGPGLE